MLADNIAPLVDVGFSSDASFLGAIDVGLYLFIQFQIYFDFAAYSFVIWLRVGMRFPENFPCPQGPQRIFGENVYSLSDWIEIISFLLSLAPRFSRSEGGISPVASNSTSPLFLTWGVMGLWHGASWTFVFWGLYHCIFIFIHRLIAPLQFRTQFLGFNLGLLMLCQLLCWAGFLLGLMILAQHLLLEEYLKFRKPVWIVALRETAT